METSDRLDTWIPRLMVLTILAVATFAFVQSYTHVYYLGQTHHETGASLRMLPLSVDWLMFAAGLTRLHLKRKNVRHWMPLGGLALGAIATLIANIASGIIWGWETAAISAWAPVVLFVTVELGMLLVRTAKAKAQPELSEAKLSELRQALNRGDITHNQARTELGITQPAPEPSLETAMMPAVPEAVTGGPQENLAGWGRLGQPGEPAGQPEQLGRQQSGGLQGIGLANGRK